MVINRMRFLLLIVWVMLGSHPVFAKPRYIDPDGCLSCHAYKGLKFINKQGVLRSATIDRSHYASSLHGSVPCKDCHRKVVDFPHKVENTEVDCSESCHIEEPSEGVKYSHDVIHKEMDKSVHSDGWYQGLTGGNRLEEIETEQDPSCRHCHSNTLYIAETQLATFKTEFDHVDTECGNCHQGKAWRGQFGGHVLRRLIGRRWNSQENNQLCVNCHGDTKKMSKVEQKDPETLKKHPPSERFVHSAESYAKTLHGRLIADNSQYGASCIDCHAPEGWKHEIRSYTDALSASHPNNLPETCGQSNCHGYVKKPGNEGFMLTDMHNISWLSLTDMDAPLEDKALRQSTWFWSSWPLLLLALVFAVGSLVWWLLFRNMKKITPIVGGDRFERVIVGRKGKASRKKPTKKPAVKKAVKTVVEVAEVVEPTMNVDNKKSDMAKSELLDTSLATPDKPAEIDKIATELPKVDNNFDNKGT